MKKTKKLISITTALVASAMLAVPSSAYLTVYENGARELASNNGTWKVTFDLARTDEIAKTEKMYLVVSVTDNSKYEEEKSAGYYITDEPAGTDENGEELPPPAFTDFQGQFGVSAAEWYEFSYEGLGDTAATDTVLGVKKLSDGKYLLTADIAARGVEFTEFGTSASLGEWGNASPNYTLSVEEFFLCGEDRVIVYYDNLGNADYEHAMPDYDLSGEASAPAETTTTAAETTAAPADETTAGGAEATTAAAESAAATTAASASGSTQSAASEDFGSRDSTLLIVGIAAGVVIVGVIVALVIVMAKKKG